MKVEALEEQNLALLQAVFLTNKSNASACRCYEKAGGSVGASDVVLYEYKD